MGSRGVSFLSQMKTIADCCRCKSFPLATVRRGRAAGGPAALLTAAYDGSTSWLVEGGFGSSLCCLVSFQTSPYSLFIGLSHISLAVWFLGSVPTRKPPVPLLHLGTCCFLSLESAGASSGPFLKLGDRLCSSLLC